MSAQTELAGLIVSREHAALTYALLARAIVSLGPLRGCDSRWWLEADAASIAYDLATAEEARSRRLGTVAW